MSKTHAEKSAYKQNFHFINNFPFLSSIQLDEVLFGNAIVFESKIFGAFFFYS